jgi:broad specificity phosphatase PhoE
VSAASSEAPRLVLVRHGQASLGTDDYDRLSERGHRQAERIARRLSDSIASGALLWSGTLRRHRQTLAPLAGERCEQVTRTRDLDEFSTRGLVRAALEQSARLNLPLPPRQQLADPVTHLDVLLAWFPRVMAAWQEEGLVDPETGTWSDFLERVMRPSDDWASTLRSGRSVVVVSSAGVIATVVAALAGRDLAWQRDLAVTLYNASVTELRLAGDSWQLGACNCTRHLEDESLRTRA